MKILLGVTLCAVAALIMVSMTSGCAYFQKNVVPIAKDLTTKYCAVPEDERMLIRGQVNQAITPNSIVVTCAAPQPANQ